jgi:hypothetical protein
VRVTIVPAAEAVHLVVREIHHLARVYSLYDVAQILLAGRERYHLRFELSDRAPSIFKSRKDPSLWLTKDEAIAHFWNSPLAREMYESEEVETDPPAGNFQVVARCGMSGEWLGPPNFHAYQTNLRRIHREQFSHMPFEFYASRVRTERGEEAVNAWLDTMRKRVRWRMRRAAEATVVTTAVEETPAAPEPVADESAEAAEPVAEASEEVVVAETTESPEAADPAEEDVKAVASDDDSGWTFDRSEIERDFATKHFGEVYEEVRSAEVSGGIVARNLSSGLLACVRIAGSHARKHPAILIPTICRLLETEHLSVFKREGKLFTGPARPHPLMTDAILAERPAAIVEWLEANPNKKLADLWKGLLPEGQTEPGNEWLADLFWLLTQGHVLLFADDSLVLPRRRTPQGSAPAAAPAKPAAKAAKKKKRKRRRRTRGPKVVVENPAKMIRAITRMKPSRLKLLRGPAMIWKRRLEKRGRIASLVEE